MCEEETWLAFFPIEPATPGHTLIIPRTHYPDLWALEPDLAPALMEAVIRVGLAVRSALAPEGMNLITSSGEVAEQSVFHLHLHVVPRWGSDDVDTIWPPKRPMAENVEHDLAARIRRECADR